VVSGIRNSLPRRDPGRYGDGWPAIYPTRTGRSSARRPVRPGQPVYDRRVQAISYDAYGAAPALVEVDAPECPADGVVIEVRASGVCRSDWHAWKGHDPVALPQIPGHEFAGVVVVVGPEVTTCAIGDRVTVPFVCGCGRCEWCVSGEAQVCPQQSQPGFTMPGSFAQFVAIPAADFNVVHLPADIDFVAAASLGCRFATAYRAVSVHGRVRAGDWVAVYGCGGVGLSAVMIAVALGARVIAVDRSNAALARARELGAEVVLEAGDDAASRVVLVTGGGAAVSLDAVGSPTTAAASLSSLRPRGRHVQVGLLLGDDASPALPMGQVIAKELEIYGSHGMAARDYPGMLALVSSGALRPDRLVGDVIGLSEAGSALAAMSAPAPGHGVTVVRMPWTRDAEGTTAP
jgi:D-arabinose 1-dehydrogenase-like Zn-dependent alcohol dehydrogenase